MLRLKEVADSCPKLLVVARIYTAKPHSNGEGYKGTAFHLRLKDEVDLDEGIVRCRQMMVRCLEIGLPVADELLYPQLYDCTKDLVSYWFVGARSGEDSLHRDFASGLDVCCGIKNPIDGDIERCVDSIYAVSRPRAFPYGCMQYATEGCKFAHIVLRGGQTKGQYISNNNIESISLAKELLRKQGLNDYVMVDLNHANSGKVAFAQLDNARGALQIGADGVMIESYLLGGKGCGYGVSQTDDCLDIETTEGLLRFINDAL